MILDERGRKYQPLPPRATEILKEVAARGKVERGEIYKIVEMSESTGRRVLKSLFEAGLLVTETDWHRAPVRLGFPVQFAAQLFPNLFPDDAQALNLQRIWIIIIPERQSFGFMTKLEPYQFLGKIRTVRMSTGLLPKANFKNLYIIYMYIIDAR